MKVTVCVKRVPSTATRIKIGADGQSIDESGIEYVINPYDEYAVEKALQLVEAAGEGEVTILTLGPDAVTKELRTCLAMGAAKAVHLVHETSFRDPLTVARALTTQLQSMDSDLILFGRQAVDNDNAQIGLMVATLLQYPAVPDVVAVEVEGDHLQVVREVEGGSRETYQLSLPCVLTAQKGLAEPRYPNLKGIMAAKKKPIEATPADLPDSVQSAEKLKLPPERAAGRIVGEGVEAIPELLRILREDAGVI